MSEETSLNETETETETESLESNDNNVEKKPEDENVQAVQEAQQETFTSEYDEARARALIDKLRSEVKEVKASQGVKLSKIEGELAQARLENLKLNAAISAGLDVDLASRLRGSTAEELQADAESLVSKFTSKSRLPEPVLTGGTNPPAALDETPEQIANRVRI